MIMSIRSKGLTTGLYQRKEIYDIRGLGANINEVVRKNNGHHLYDTADARFVVRLSLCNMKQNS